MWSQLKSTRACPITESQFACLGYASFLGLIGVLESQRVTHLDTPPPSQWYECIHINVSQQWSVQTSQRQSEWPRCQVFTQRNAYPWKKYTLSECKLEFYKPVSAQTVESFLSLCNWTWLIWAAPLENCSKCLRKPWRLSRFKATRYNLARRVQCALY